MHDLYYTLEWFHHFAVVSSKFSEGPCLLLKDFGDRLNRIAVFELPSKRVIDQFHACLLFVVMQGSLEEGLKHRARWFAHITGSLVEVIWVSVEESDRCEEMRDKGRWHPGCTASAARLPRGECTARHVLPHREEFPRLSSISNSRFGDEAEPHPAVLRMPPRGRESILESTYSPPPSPMEIGPFLFCLFVIPL